MSSDFSMDLSSVSSWFESLSSWCMRDIRHFLRWNAFPKLRVSTLISEDFDGAVLWTISTLDTFSNSYIFCVFPPFPSSILSCCSRVLLLIFLFLLLLSLLFLLLLPTGNMYSWGSATNNALGHGDEEDKEEPEVVTSKQLETRQVLAVSAGGQHSAILAIANNNNNNKVAWEASRARYHKQRKQHSTHYEPNSAG